MFVQREMVAGVGDTAARCHRVREKHLSENGCCENVCAGCHVTTCHPHPITGGWLVID